MRSHAFVCVIFSLPSFFHWPPGACPLQSSTSHNCSQSHGCSNIPATDREWGPRKHGRARQRHTLRRFPERPRRKEAAPRSPRRNLSSAVSVFPDGSSFSLTPHLYAEEK